MNTTVGERAENPGCAVPDDQPQVVSASGRGDAVRLPSVCGIDVQLSTSDIKSSIGGDQLFNSGLQTSAMSGSEVGRNFVLILHRPDEIRVNFTGKQATSRRTIAITTCTPRVVFEHIRTPYWCCDCLDVGDHRRSKFGVRKE